MNSISEFLIAQLVLVMFYAIPIAFGVGVGLIWKVFKFILK